MEAGQGPLSVKIAQRVPTDATTREWRLLAQDDPLFAVAAWRGKERGGWTPEDFYAAGLEDWADFKRVWTQYAHLGGTCVEIGCGAGRITQGLAATFDHVVALDVSPDMLALARNQVPEAEFVLVDSTTIPLAEESVDAVFSCHVLQHLETAADVGAYLGDAHRVLRAGGTAMVHLLLAVEPKPFLRALSSEARLRLTRALSRNRGAYSRVRRYRPDEVRALLERVGFVDVELREFRLRGSSTPHAFWFARK